MPKGPSAGASAYVSYGARSQSSHRADQPNVHDRLRHLRRRGSR
jgi:hypothetical protein